VLHGLPDSFKPVATGRTSQHHGQHFTVRTGGKTHPVAQHGGSQLGGIHKVAIVCHGNLSVLGVNQVGLGVAQGGRAGGGVTDMPDGKIPRQCADSGRGKDLGYQPGIFMHADFPAIGNRNSGSFLPAVLQRVQPKECHPRYILAGGINPQHTAFLLGMLIRQPARPVCRINHASLHHPG